MKYIIQGGVPLRGEVTPSGSKNAALPIIAATLLSDEQFILENIPDIQDVHTLLSIMEYIGSEYTFSNNVLTIQTKKINKTSIPHELVSKLRASIVLLGPFLGRVGKIHMSYPGGCVIGKRPIDTHIDALKELSVRGEATASDIRLSSRKLIGAEVILKEISVTATENLVTAGVLASGQTVIRLAACEPHPQDLCNFLTAAGASISGIGTHTVTVSGVKKISGIRYRIISDYLEIGTYAIAAAATEGDITIHDARRHDLDALWQKLHETGVKLTFENNSVRVIGPKKLHAIRKIDTGIFPKFPTDLQAPFMALMTKAEGVSKIFETLFEGRLNYLFELEKMGAHIEFLNPHQALVIGPTTLRGVQIASCDIRAGAGMVVAALMANGETEITNVNYIERGYEDLHQKLEKLGAQIQRIDEMHTVRSIKVAKPLKSTARKSEKILA